MTTFVLIPGAFRGAWAWSRVVPLLTAQGHEGIPIELRRADDPAFGLGEHIADLAEQVNAANVTDAVLVGHSQGGFLARVLAQEVGDRLRAVAYLDAPIPHDGERAVDLQPWGALHVPQRELIVTPPPLPDAASASDDARWIAERVTPQAVAMALDPVTLTDLRLPEHIAFCSRTPDTYPCATTRSRMDEAGEPYVLLDAGHDAPITAPALVADWLLGLATTAR